MEVQFLCEAAAKGNLYEYIRNRGGRNLTIEKGEDNEPLAYIGESAVYEELKEADKDKDGKITIEELKAYQAFVCRERTAGDKAAEYFGFLDLPKEPVFEIPYLEIAFKLWLAPFTDAQLTNISEAAQTKLRFGGPEPDLGSLGKVRKSSAGLGFRVYLFSLIGTGLDYDWLYYKAERYDRIQIHPYPYYRFRDFVMSFSPTKIPISLRVPLTRKKAVGAADLFAEVSFLPSPSKGSSRILEHGALIDGGCIHGCYDSSKDLEEIKIGGVQLTESTTFRIGPRFQAGFNRLWPLFAVGLFYRYERNVIEGQGVLSGVKLESGNHGIEFNLELGLTAVQF